MIVPINQTSAHDLIDEIRKRNQAAYDAARRAEFMRLGLCIQCRAPKEPHYSRCERCLKQHRDRVAKRKAVTA